MSVSSRNIFAIALAGILIAPAEALAIVRTFTIHADGACAGTSSQATADGTLTLDTETRVLTYDIAIVGVTPAETHIHGPADICLSARFAPVFFALPSGQHPTGSRIISDPYPELFLQGRMWFNVHGELGGIPVITGQIIPDCVNGCSGRGSCNLGVCTCQPGWGGSDCSLEVPVPTLSNVGLATLASLLMAVGAAMIWRRRSVRPE